MLKTGLTKTKLLILRLTWLFLWLIILILMFFSFHRTHSPETVLAGTMFMYIAAFPISLLGTFVMMALAKIYSMAEVSQSYAVNPIFGYIDLFVLWLFLFMAGYFQWFILLPYVVKKSRLLWGHLKRKSSSL